MAKLSGMMVCIDCDEVFPYGSTCPRCASRQVFPLDKWVRPRPAVTPACMAPVPQPECAEMVAAWTR